MKKMAIMFSCFNREEQTKRCLETIYLQKDSLKDIAVDIFIYDDGSTDATLQMIDNFFPDAKVTKGSGNMYWSRSMYILMKQVCTLGYDFYLIINDDVKFFQNALQIMYETYRMANAHVGIVGACKSAVTGEQTYGGRDGKGNIILPSMQLKRCIWANWNCFLIDKYVVDHVGIIDGKFQHAFGDFEYSNRMNKYGFEIFSSVDYVGECETNSKEGTCADKNVPRMLRLKKLFSPKGIPPYSYFRYNFKIEGIKGLLKSVYGYCSLLYYIFAGKDLN